VQAIEPEQGAGGVAAAATKTRAVGDGFAEKNLVAHGDAGGGFVSSEGLDDEISLVARHAWVVAGKFEFRGIPEFQLIGEARDFHHESVDFMESIVAFAEHA
jgi:hypothetical protein